MVHFAHVSCNHAFRQDPAVIDFMPSMASYERPLHGGYNFDESQYVNTGMADDTPTHGSMDCSGSQDISMGGDENAAPARKSVGAPTSCNPTGMLLGDDCSNGGMMGGQSQSAMASCHAPLRHANRNSVNPPGGGLPGQNGSLLTGGSDWCGGRGRGGAFEELHTSTPSWMARHADYSNTAAQQRAAPAPDAAKYEAEKRAFFQDQDPMAAENPAKRQRFAPSTFGAGNNLLVFR